MPIIQTSGLRPGELVQDRTTNHQVYCGLDAAVTLEIWNTVRDLYPTPKVYPFALALQAPYLEIMTRGFKVNEEARQEAVAALRARGASLQSTLNLFSEAVWGRNLNPNSPKQLKEFFYEKMHIPPVVISKKGEKKVSTDREALEKIEIYMHARPFVSLILDLRGIGKDLSVLDGAIDLDGRYRAGYNITGTETGRPSSSENAFGTGGNAQNIAPANRFIFEADPGWKMAVIDLEQVEARDVGFVQGCLFGDWKFLDSCESGDLHSNNAKLIWPELEWTGEAKTDRRVAEQNFYRDFSYRDMSKRGGHLSNYYGTAWTAARALKVPLPIMEEFQARYCRGSAAAFPAHQQWWTWTAEQLQTKGFIETPFGRKRHFFGRPNDDTTLREAIAFLPQSMTADRMNLGLWRIWKHMVPEVQLLAQTYDSVTFQYPDRGHEYEKKILSRALELIRVPLVAPNGRVFNVPGEAKIGWNWGNRVETKPKPGMPSVPVKNPFGLQKFTPSSPDPRHRPSRGRGT